MKTYTLLVETIFRGISVTSLSFDSEYDAEFAYNRLTVEQPPTLEYSRVVTRLYNPVFNHTFL